MTLEESIFFHSQKTPGRTAVVSDGKCLSYSELWEGILDRSEQLRSEGLSASRPYVFRAVQDWDFILTYCAVHHLGAIAVPLEKGIPEEKFLQIKSEAESCTFSADICDILYTTGTTGKSKGVMLSVPAWEAIADNLIHGLGLSSELLFIVSGPLNHIASLCKIHPVLTVGGAVCILDGLKDMNAFFDVFNLPFTKFATFLVPASLRMIMQFSYDKLCSLADKVDFIETGAAPISGSDMEQLSRALPHSRLYNTLGGTEVGAVCCYNFNDGRFMEGCIGRPMRNSMLEVAEDGHIMISGKTLMSGYVNDPQATAAVLSDGRIHSSDLGYIDSEGLVHLKGRQGDVINVGGFKVNPVEVENAVSSHPSVKDCICIAATHPVVGTVLKLLVVLQEGASLDKRSLALHIKSRLEPHKVPVYYEAVDEIRRTYNGKLDRKFYI